MTEWIWTERRMNRISQLYSIQLHRNFELLNYNNFLKFKSLLYCTAEPTLSSDFLRMSSFCCCGNWKNTDDGDINFNQLILWIFIS
ncbi:hypothetical protein T4C_3316 [Trichinella pseudospiralis]|uniref:Uncharacterized protein n=1 Tax=Trichinella pseudospiralis TaxID=6337 RepID=A0A0V1KCZ0_TRIPS|nr:hypothetical protein T4C_3316 [Trichinella pseudospiralis]